MEDTTRVAGEGQDVNDVPLRHRIWHLYCDGESYTAIAQHLQLDRQTVARHVQAVQRLLAAQHHIQAEACAASALTTSPKTPPSPPPPLFPRERGRG